jgi:Zn-dependent protease
MGEWIAILAGLLLLQAIVVVRQFASLRFPRMRWLPMPSARPPSAYADLFGQTDAELRALGFEPLGWAGAIDDDTGARALVRLYAHPQEQSSAFVQPPIEPNQPDSLVVSFGNLLADDSSLASFRGSPVNEFFATARQRRRSFAVEDTAALWQAHRAWRNEFGMADAMPPIDTLDAAAAVSTRRFALLADELVAERTLHREHDGSLRVRIRAMPRLWRTLRRAPKAKPDPTPPSIARERALLPLVERLRERAPSTGMQIALLVATTALSALLGGLLWDWHYAGLLAGALLLHEGGHWLAMRALGYRHVQMVLLPLLGGITTGVESDPRGTHRAIVSLMGPLPGIVIGWALLAWGVHGGPAGVIPAATVLLVLNYLNLLPIPPLDGGHFLQSLLPRGWALVEAVLVGLLLLAGIAFAIFTRWWILLVLVAVQVFALRMNFRDARLAARIRADVDPAAMARHALDDRIVAAVAREQPQAKPLQRLARALRLRTLLLLQPPGTPARVALLCVYAAAFVVPLATSPALTGIVRTVAGAAAPRSIDDAAMAERSDRYLRRLRAQEAESAALDDAHLLAGIEAAANEPGLLDTGARLPAPTTAPSDEAAFAAAQARLGVALPAGYRQLALAPQRDLLQVRAPDRLVHAGAEYAEWLDQWTDSGRHEVPVFAAAAEGTDAPSVLTRARLANAIVIGGGIDEGLLLHDAGGDPCCRIIEFGDEDASGYPDLHAWLVAQHVNRTLAAETSRRMREVRTRELAASATLDLPALLQALTAGAHVPAWPDVDSAPPAADTIATAAQRLGTLPEDYRALFALRNGVPSIGLLPIEEAVPADTATIAHLLGDSECTRISDEGEAQDTFHAADVVAPAPVLGIWQPHRARTDVTTRAAILLVRFGNAPPRYLDLGTRRAYASLRRLLRERLATQRATAAALD